MAKRRVDSPFLKIGEVAAWLRCDNRSVHRRMDDGLFKGAPEGNRTLIDRNSFEAYCRDVLGVPYENDVCIIGKDSGTNQTR